MSALTFADIARALTCWKCGEPAPADQIEIIYSPGISLAHGQDESISIRWNCIECGRYFEAFIYPPHQHWNVLFAEYNKRRFSNARLS